MKSKLLKLSVVLLLVSSCAEFELNPEDIPLRVEAIETTFTPVTLEELGKPSSVDQLLEYTSYSIGYNYEFKHAAWAGYVLQPELVRLDINGDDSYKKEDLIPASHRATLSDYGGTGFVKEQLAPPEALNHSEISMEDTYYLSNVTPQRLTFSAVHWWQLNRYVEDCVELYEDGEQIFVFTGAIFEGTNQHIGEDVIVPGAYYKVIYEFNGPQASAVAFVAPHASFDFEELENYVRSIDYIEEVTGLDFGKNIPDDIETQLEKDVSPVCTLP